MGYAHLDDTDLILDFKLDVGVFVCHDGVLSRIYLFGPTRQDVALRSSPLIPWSGCNC